VAWELVAVVTEEAAAGSGLTPGGPWCSRSRQGGAGVSNRADQLLTRIVAFSATHSSGGSDWPDERNARSSGRAAVEHGHSIPVPGHSERAARAEAGGRNGLEALDRPARRGIITGGSTAGASTKRSRVRPGHRLADGGTLRCNGVGAHRAPAAARRHAARGTRGRRAPAYLLGIFSVNPEDRAPGSRRGRMLAESAVVEEMPVWLEVNGEPA